MKDPYYLFSRGFSALYCRKYILYLRQVSRIAIRDTILDILRIMKREMRIAFK